MVELRSGDWIRMGEEMEARVFFPLHNGRLQEAASMHTRVAMPPLPVQDLSDADEGLSDPIAAVSSEYSPPTLHAGRWPRGVSDLGPRGSVSALSPPGLLGGKAFQHNGTGLNVFCNSSSLSPSPCLSDQQRQSGRVSWGTAAAAAVTAAGSPASSWRDDSHSAGGYPACDRMSWELDAAREASCPHAQAGAFLYSSDRMSWELPPEFEDAEANRGPPLPPLPQNSQGLDRAYSSNLYGSNIGGSGSFQYDKSTQKAPEALSPAPCSPLSSTSGSAYSDANPQGSSSVFTWVSGRRSSQRMDPLEAKVRQQWANGASSYLLHISSEPTPVMRRSRTASSSNGSLAADFAPKEAACPCEDDRQWMGGSAPKATTAPLRSPTLPLRTAAPPARPDSTLPSPRQQRGEAAAAVGTDSCTGAAAAAAAAAALDRFRFTGGGRRRNPVGRAVTLSVLTEAVREQDEEGL